MKAKLLKFLKGILFLSILCSPVFYVIYHAEHLSYDNDERVTKVFATPAEDAAARDAFVRQQQQHDGKSMDSERKWLDFINWISPDPLVVVFCFILIVTLLANLL